MAKPEPSASNDEAGACGSVVRIRGSVVDVRFERKLPALLDALIVRIDDDRVVPLEVQQHLDGHTVRTVALAFTAGMRRGMPPGPGEEDDDDDDDEDSEAGLE